MKNGHKIVLEWAKENDEAVEKFKRNTRLLAIAMDRILNKTEEKNGMIPKWSSLEMKDIRFLTDVEIRELVAYFTTRSQPLSQREVEMLEVAETFLDDDEIEVRDYWNDIASDGEADGDALASAGWGTDEDYGCYGGEDW